MMKGTSSAYMRIEGKTLMVVVSERAAFDAVPGEMVQREAVMVKELHTADDVVLIFQYWPGQEAHVEPRPVVLLDMFEQARHGVIVLHRRRSDEERTLCKKLFRIDAAKVRRGYDRECIQCRQLAKEFAQKVEAPNGTQP